MIRASIAVVAALAVAAMVGSGAFAKSATTQTLTATVGPSLTLTVTLNGKTVKTLKAGTYNFVVKDMSKIHAFAMTAPLNHTVNYTGISFVGTKTAKVKFVPGLYRAYCPVHATYMYQTFNVTS